MATVKVPDVISAGGTVGGVAVEEQTVHVMDAAGDVGEDGEAIRAIGQRAGGNVERVLGGTDGVLRREGIGDVVGGAEGSIGASANELEIGGSEGIDGVEWSC